MKSFIDVTILVEPPLRLAKEKLLRSILCVHVIVDRCPNRNNENLCQYNRPQGPVSI